MAAVKQIMTRDVAAIGKDNSIADAAKKMASMDVGFLPVSEDDAVVGVVTDRDITVRGVAEGLDPETTEIGRVMTSGADFVDEDDSLEEVARHMKEKRIRRVLVRGSNGGPDVAGVVTLGDLAVALDDKGLYAEALEEISRPAEPAR